MTYSWHSRGELLASSVRDRRSFLTVAGLAAAGLVLSSSRVTYASPIFDAVAQFADAVGARVAAGNISDYVKDAQDLKGAAGVVRRVNASLRRSGFVDTTQSAVYVLPEEETYFFSPVRHKDQFNVMVNFFDSKGGKGTRLVCSLDGPTLLGVGALAATVARKQPKEVTRKALLPRKGIRIVSLSISRSYKRPNLYATDDGTVLVNYKTDGKGRGTVRVEAKDRRGALLAGGDYDLSYNTTA